MPALILPYLTRFAPWILAALLAIGGVIYVRHLQDALRVANADIVIARTTIARLSAANKQNLATLRRLRSEEAAWRAALTTTMTTDNRDTRFTDGLLNGIAAAPARNDAPVAPVLAATLAAIAKAQGKMR
ncbi:hypothetical protein AiwAL_04600 [Acidiphilium sp. AL]|uniref:Uncharacterized protein n=2 Tax=Acidiphilium iwatense TaxID=768198 RepID=A0ABS9DRE4_9PROT|nr:hypothetical protein [Acidiphilium sp. AL]MCF3945323.1 hypothetical protein [Acidiphilium iwatense]MCU4159383.1 hypothetical protein [Acidiphilium sp. AL]